MLAAWTLPSRYLSPVRRERLLIWLDMLGKWSLLDSYVLVMMMVAFNFDLAWALGDLGYYHPAS
jgi:uncharacterized paraquat-inducible protein A